MPNMNLNSFKFQCSLYSAKRETYDFHTLPAWCLRNGVFDETVRKKGL